MINIEKLFDKFSKHAASCKSAPFVLNANAAFESWFRVELIPPLNELGYEFRNIETNYTYPNSRDKADLCLKSAQGNIVFELKSFVSGQDSNKKEKYPGQIEKLEKLISSSNIVQVISLTTFIGYSETQMMRYINNFFKSKSWTILGPMKLVEQHNLYVTITSLINRGHFAQQRAKRLTLKP